MCIKFHIASLLLSAALLFTGCRAQTAPHCVRITLAFRDSLVPESTMAEAQKMLAARLKADTLDAEVYIQDKHIVLDASCEALKKNVHSILSEQRIDIYENLDLSEIGIILDKIRKADPALDHLLQKMGNDTGPKLGICSDGDTWQVLSSLNRYKDMFPTGATFFIVPKYEHETYNGLYAVRTDKKILDIHKFRKAELIHDKTPSGEDRLFIHLSIDKPYTAAWQQMIMGGRFYSAIVNDKMLVCFLPGDMPGKNDLYIMTNNIAQVQQLINSVNFPLPAGLVITSESIIEKDNAKR